MHKKMKFSETLWHCGKKVGEISGIFSIINLPIVKQMRIGVLTKHGIFFTSRPFLQETQTGGTIKVYKDGDNPLKQLILAKNKLI